MIRQFTLEVQTGRHALYELKALAAEAHFYVNKEARRWKTREGSQGVSGGGSTGKRRVSVR